MHYRRNKASLEARTFRTPPQPDLVVGSAVIYCRLLGTVQFVGETSLGPGLWAGIELKSKNGTNDGSIKSGRKSTRYFTCRKKYGIFARLSSLTLAPPPPTVVDGPRPMISRQFSMADVVEMATAAAKSKGDLKGKPEMYIYKGRPEDLRPLAVMQRLPAPMKYEPLEGTNLFICLFMKSSRAWCVFHMSHCKVLTMHHYQAKRLFFTCFRRLERRRVLVLPVQL